jgi:hypothetical protein
LLDGLSAFSVVRSLPHGHVAATLGTILKLDLHNLIAPEPSHTKCPLAKYGYSRDRKKGFLQIVGESL